MRLVYLPDELDVRMPLDHRPDGRVPIGQVGLIDLGGDLQGQPAAGGDRDRPVRPSPRRGPPQEGEIAALRLRRERPEVARRAVASGDATGDGKRRWQGKSGDGEI